MTPLCSFLNVLSLKKDKNCFFLKPFYNLCKKIDASITISQKVLLGNFVMEWKNVPLPWSTDIFISPLFSFKIGWFFLWQCRVFITFATEQSQTDRNVLMETCLIWNVVTYYRLTPLPPNNPRLIVIAFSIGMGIIGSQSSAFLSLRWCHRFLVKAQHRDALM